MYMKPISKSANLIIDGLVGVGAWQARDKRPFEVVHESRKCSWQKGSEGYKGSGLGGCYVNRINMLNKQEYGNFYDSF